MPDFVEQLFAIRHGGLLETENNGYKEKMNGKDVLVT
jgi:hypothetical protein